MVAAHDWSLIVSEPLSNADIRVLGSLIEKEQTTPEYYPLSLNALVNACNQSSNRDPVVEFDEGTVARSIEALRHRGLVRATRGIDARVTKYAHRMDDVMGLHIREVVVLCVLMLRGTQTAGELRTRTSRMETFEDLTEVEGILDGLVVKELVVRLPRQPGQKEVRYAHLLAGDVPVATPAPAQPSARPAMSTSADADRLTVLEEEVKELRKEVTDLRAQIEAFQAQFE
jgi:uncharacterized protein YceH (UPF0502 family)